MDSFQHSHGYMRTPPPPPPPHTADHHHHQFHQIQPPRQPASLQGPWYSSQFQYHPSQTPSPPPHWALPPPPPHSDHFPPTTAYPPVSNIYPPPHSYHHNHFPTPPPPPRSHVLPQSHITHPYPQELGTSNWPPKQGWDYPAHKNEDWAARARAWADAKAAMESQHPQSQFAPSGELQEQSYYHDQYQQTVDSCYPDIQNQSHSSSSYQQFPISEASLQQLPRFSQEAASVSLEASYASDGHLPYSASDGTTTGAPTVAFQHQGNLPTNPSVHQQEVPSSYSSVTGKETADQSQQSYTLLHLSNSSSQEQQHHVQPSMQGPPASGSHSIDPAINLADKPLDFTPRFNRDSDLQMQSTYAHHDSATLVRGIDPVNGLPSMNNWAPPVTPGVAYPPIPPVLASGLQHDPSITKPSVPGHVAPPFGRFPGPGLPPTMPPGSAPFSTDAYGAPGVPERPKKASVPNWLREEIKKVIIAPPSVENYKEEIKLVDNGVDKSYVKDDEQDSKSNDSSRSAEEEEDEEDHVEAARTAAINQEIKRVLTEVLLKVTDELFDEIATKVLSEDDLNAEVGLNVATSTHKASTSPPSAPVPKASAKVLVPVKAQESENDDFSERSNSSPPGDVLGLGNYASDADDRDDEIKSFSVPTAKDAAHQSGINKPFEEHCRSQTNLLNNLGKNSSIQSKTINGAAINQLQDDKEAKELDCAHLSKVVSEDGDKELNDFEKRHDRSNDPHSNGTLGITKSDLPGKIAGVEKSTDDHPGRENRTRSDKTDRRGKSSSEKDFVKEVQSSKIREDEKGNENHRKKDERHQIKEKADESNEAKERVKEHDVRHAEKTKESKSRKRSSHANGKDNRKEAEKVHRGGTIEDTSRKKDHTKDKGELRSGHKYASNSDGHKRRRSSSVSSRGRSSWDHAVSHDSHSGGEGSDGSKRKLHSRKRDLSPSPVRSRRRQVSRSPHSKHSQRRHSPYSSLDTSRGRRSRSRSPVWQQR